MIIENISSDFLMWEEPKCVFSDDSRFIYMLQCWSEPLSISVYDIIYNKFITLLPDKSVTDLLIQFNGFEQDTMRPSFLFIDYNTLLILFNENVVIERFHGSVLLLVIKLNFSNKSFSIADNKIISDCYSEAKLVKNDTHFLIVHTFAVDKHIFEDGEQFLGYFAFYLHDNQKLEILENRVVFDFDYQSSGYMATWHAFNNKLWCIRKIGRTPNLQLLYFNLTETHPKGNDFEIFNVIGEDDSLPNLTLMFQWINDVLIKYSRSEGYFQYLDLTSCQWSHIFQRGNIFKIERTISEFKRFKRYDTVGECVVFERHFDRDFNVLIFDKTRKLLYKVPFKTPHKLIDIAWVTVLKNGLLNELNKKQIIIFPMLY